MQFRVDCDVNKGSQGINAKSVQGVEQRENSGHGRVDKYVVPNYVFHHPDGKVTRSLEGYQEHLGRAYNAFPDLHFTLDDMIVEGDRVVSRWTLTGTHKKAHVGIPATNKKLKVWGITIDRFAKSKIVESWERFDTQSNATTRRHTHTKKGKIASTDTIPISVSFSFSFCECKTSVRRS